jgi:hypothetical protein
MWRSAVVDPGPTGLPGDLPNLHNRPGDLGRNLRYVIAEAALALLLLRPWSYRHSWRRALLAALLLAPWVLFNVAFLIHSGGVMALHTFWLVLLWLACAAAAAVSGVRAARVRRSAPSRTMA